MRIRAVLVVVLLAFTACSDDRSPNPPFGEANPLAPASEDEIRDAVAAFQPGIAADHSSRSALDALTATRKSELEPTAALLVGLLPSPGGFGSFRLANLQVDDPNGDGQIGEFWYPPRVLRQECSTKIDAAPGPFAVASYVPGSEPLGEVGPMAGLDVMSSAVVVGVQVQLFDEPSQLDDYLATTLAFYRDPTFTCGGEKASVQTYRETDLQTARATAICFEAEPDFMGSGVRGYTVVGDRVLLLVSVSSDAVEAPWNADDLDRWLAPIIDVALARLDVAELP